MKTDETKKTEMDILSEKPMYEKPDITVMDIEMRESFNASPIDPFTP